MIKQTIEKIGKLLKERTYSVPQILFKFYTFFSYYAFRIQKQGAQFNDITLFSDVFKLYKNYLVDQPFQLTKLTIVKLSEEFKEHDRDTIAQFVKLKERVMKEFPNFKPKEKHFYQMLAQVSNFAWISKLHPAFVQSQQIKKQVESKKKNQQVKYSQLTTTCWYRQFRGDYFVHIDIFIDYVQKFIRQYFPILSFINKESRIFLKELCDPERKYLITIMNCQDLFYKLRDPTTIIKLWQQSQQLKSQEFSKDQQSNFIQMNLLLAANKTSERIQGSRNKIKIDGTLKDLQKQSIIFIGSSVDNDIVIKSKYISRKQLMIVQQRRGQRQQKTKSKQIESLNFSIVCLSQTNFTAVKFPKPFKLHVGDIFYSQKTQYQVLKIQKQSFQIHQMEQDERTLSILPVDRQSLQSLKNSQKIIFLILSGEDKEKQFAISSQNMPSYSSSDQKHQRIISNELIHNDCFLLKAGVKILLKNANEILQNRLSKKVRLVKGLQICLEQYSLIIQ